MKLLSACLLVLSIILLGCNDTREKKTILNYTDYSKTNLLRQIDVQPERVLNIVKIKSFPSEDSLREYSCLVTAFSILNQMDFRSLNTLKRYLEAGGGGVVAIKDTALTRDGWLWLQQWNTKNVNEEFQQDNSPLYILAKNYSEKDLTVAIDYAIGDNDYPDYTKAYTIAVPDSSRYTRVVLAQGLDEPLEMSILPDNDVLFIERKGAVKIYDAKKKQVKTIANFDVFSGLEDGLLGVALDPGFVDNHWIYFYYAPAGLDSIDRLSRFELIGDSLLMDSEKILLEVNTQRTYCCHSAGDIGFGPDSLLYIAVGDNTNADDPYKVGRQPIDERPGHELADDQATAANTNDLRGKILRINPEPDGSYSIPEGNLFPVGMPKTRPEIYVMGLRNPYRFTVDKKTGILYWGEVGPSTTVRGRDGTFMSYDEVNKASSPGFYGWPYFLGNNDAFPMYDFATGKDPPPKDPKNPINDSPNNTGLKNLPSARPAMIWYGPDSSEQFPLVGSGGASVMAGPVYYSDLFHNAPFKLSEYYDGKLFIFEWIRHWIMAVTLDEDGNYLRMEPFLKNMSFSAPMDIKFGPDGALYVLEYGTNWFSKNSDAKLVRITYQEGNRNPVAVVKVDKQYGAVPFTVQLSAEDSKDYDKNDQLSYTWSIEGEQIEGEKITHTFKKSGVYKVGLTVSDNHKGRTTTYLTVSAGNTPPEVDILSSSNKSFYWDNQSFGYQVKIRDAEDETIDTTRAKISFGYLANSKDAAVILSGGKELKNLKFIKGQRLISSLDCQSCHAMDAKSVGPSFKEIAEHYAGKNNIVGMLANKIIKGGSGTWGSRQMSAHPGLSVANAKEIVNYILSLSEKNNSLPLSGQIALDDAKGNESIGAYLLSASYTDGGANGIKPLTGDDYIILKKPRLQAEDYDEGKANIVHITTTNSSYINGLLPGSYIKFEDIDLTGIQHLTYNIQQNGAGGTIALHLDNPEGQVVSTVKISAGSLTEWKEITAEVKKVKGLHDLYFVFTNANVSGQYLFNIDWIYFSDK